MRQSLSTLLRYRLCPSEPVDRDDSILVQLLGNADADDEHVVPHRHALLGPAFIRRPTADDGSTSGAAPLALALDYATPELRRLDRACPPAQHPNSPLLHSRSLHRQSVAVLRAWWDREHAPPRHRLHMRLASEQRVPYGDFQRRLEVTALPRETRQRPHHAGRTRTTKRPCHLATQMRGVFDCICARAACLTTSHTNRRPFLRPHPRAPCPGRAPTTPVPPQGAP